VEPRSKQVLTVLGPVTVERAYYHCSSCQAGMVLRDEALDIVGSSFSPGVRRMMSRVGSKESFEKGRQGLKELAGVEVTTKQVEPVSEQMGQQAESWQPLTRRFTTSRPMPSGCATPSSDARGCLSARVWSKPAARLS
jgi:hypothetical protein